MFEAKLMLFSIYDESFTANRRKTVKRLSCSLLYIIFAEETYSFNMEISGLATQQIERFFNKIAQKYPVQEEITTLTDIHIRVSQSSGELRAYDDDGNEITRCVIDDWIDNKNDDFYDRVTSVMRQVTRQMHSTLDNLGILKPYSFVLEDEDEAGPAELYVADDDTIIADGDLMEGLDDDLDHFLDDLMK